MSGTDPHPFLNKMKTGVVTDMSVNYTGSNTYATYEDGTPVHMTMQLHLKKSIQFMLMIMKLKQSTAMNHLRLVQE